MRCTQAGKLFCLLELGRMIVCLLDLVLCALKRKHSVIRKFFSLQRNAVHSNWKYGALELEKLTLCPGRMSGSLLA